MSNMEEKSRFRSCKIEIITFIDGQKTEYISNGQCRVSFPEATIRYVYEGDASEFAVLKNGAEIRRKGAFTLVLPFEEGKKTLGKTVFAGGEGNLELFTDRFSVRYEENGLHIFLEYRLLFQGEEQETKTELTVRYL